MEAPTFTTICLFGGESCWSVGSANFSFQPSPNSVRSKYEFFLCSSDGPS